MTKRRRRAVLVTFALAVVSGFTFASQASAITQDNACINSLLSTQSSFIPVTQTATASPNPVSPGGTVTLSSINATANIPGSVALAGYRAFQLPVGSFSIPVDVQMVIAGTNTVEGTQTTNVVTGTVTGTITDPTTGNRNSGDESATVDPLTVSFAAETWTAGASGLIEFREKTVTPLTAIAQGTGIGGIIINAVINGVIPLQFACDPGTVVEGADPSTIVLTDPGTTFASTQIATNPQCKKLKKQLKKAKKAKNKKKVKKIRKKMRKQGC